MNSGRWVLVVVLLSILGLLAVSVPPKESPSAPIGFADPGLITMSPGQQQAELAAMRDLGMNSLRIDARWDWVQYAGPDQYDWRDLDQLVEAADLAGLTLDVIVNGCPAWAATPGARHPASAADFGRFAATVAARYRDRPVVAYEIWNEPNQAATWGPTADPVGYTQLLIAAHDAVRQVDPTTPIVLGGLAPLRSDGVDVGAIDFLTAVYQNGGGGHFDAVGYHPYCYPALPSTFQPWSGWSQMAQTTPSIRSVMTANGDAARPIWITEFGAPSHGPNGVGEPAQAQALAEAIELTGAAGGSGPTGGVGALYLYSWRDRGTNPGDDEDWFGLMSTSGALKPAFGRVWERFVSPG
jgi:polysaccharide biosynthesis protein PslG